MSSFLQSLGLCKAAGALLTGEDTVRSAARAGRVRLVLTACDAGAAAQRRAQQASADAKAPYFRLDAAKEELGAALGLGPVSIAAVTDKGLAAMMERKLAENGKRSAAADDRSGNIRVKGKED